MLRAENEMNKLWANHPDARDLDAIGREEDASSESLLRVSGPGMYRTRTGWWIGKKAYALAKKCGYRPIQIKGKRAAMGMVADKKGSVTERPSDQFQGRRCAVC